MNNWTSIPPNKTRIERGRWNGGNIEKLLESIWLNWICTLKPETICMTGNTVVNQNVFHFLKILFWVLSVWGNWVNCTLFSEDCQQEWNETIFMTGNTVVFIVNQSVFFISTQLTILYYDIRQVDYLIADGSLLQP